MEPLAPIFDHLHWTAENVFQEIINLSNILILSNCWMEMKTTTLDTIPVLFTSNGPHFLDMVTSNHFCVLFSSLAKYVSSTITMVGIWDVTFIGFLDKFFMLKHNIPWWIESISYGNKLLQKNCQPQHKPVTSWCATTYILYLREAVAMKKKNF